MFCVKCGRPISDDAVFCEVCGFDQRNIPQEQPAAEQPAHQQPVSEQPVYEQPVYEQPAYEQPVYQQPAYEQPVYQQPAYEQPVYQQPVYEQPEYQPPVQTGKPVAATTVKAAKAGSGALKWVLIAAALVGVAVFVVMQFGLLDVFKSDEDLIRERIEALEAAYNATDWEAVLECMDETTKTMLETTMGFADNLLSDAIGFDFGMSDMFSLGGLITDGDFCQIEITDIQIDGDSATVSVIMRMELYGYSDSQEMTLPMVKDGGDWYISAVGDLGDLSGLIGYGH